MRIVEKKNLVYLGILAVLGSLWYLAFTPILAQPFQNTACAIAPNLSSKAHRVPDGALWKKETIRQAAIPENYQTVVAWINTATALPCVDPKTPARVDIRAVRIIEQDLATKEERLVENISFENDREKFQGGLFQRQPVWFGPGEGDTASRLEHFQDRVLSIDLTMAPNRIYHGWTDPRTPARPGTRHIVEAEVRISGAARLQLGVDYWKDMETDYSGYDELCETSQNCEAWIGRWYGDTKGKWKTIRSPKDFD